jgi:very-short-patch-repair endonuclease
MDYIKLTEDQKKQTIYESYVKNKKSFIDIAKELNTYANKIRRDAIKYKIDIRNKSDAQKNALETGATKHPTKGKKRSQETKQKIGLSVMENWESLSENELKKRKQKAKKQWESMTEEQKQNMLKLANEAVRNSSKVGSKLEKFLLDGLIKGGYRVDFHKEQTLLTTKLQIDLFISSLNIAIEVDGPSHFLPVWGDDTLARNIKYDNKKTGLLLGKGCVIIRVKQTKDFSPSRAQKILDIILSNIKIIENSYPEPDKRIIEIGD